MEPYVDADHIRALIKSSRLEILDAAVSAEAERHLELFFPLRSWSSVIDWDRLPSSTLNWNQVSDEDALAWAMTTIAGRSPLGLVLYHPEQPCLLGEFEFMVRHFDELVWKAPGCRLLLGVERLPNGNIAFGKGVIEFNGKGELFGSTDV
jgi:hypothetical protein